MTKSLTHSLAFKPVQMRSKKEALVYKHIELLLSKVTRLKELVKKQKVDKIARKRISSQSPSRVSPPLTSSIENVLKESSIDINIKIED